MENEVSIISVQRKSVTFSMKSKEGSGVLCAISRLPCQNAAFKHIALHSNCINVQDLTLEVGD